jgi:hypothetical protein
MGVRDYSPAVEEMAEHWPMLDAVYGGTHEMREAGKRFLPQWPGEDDESYKNRLKTAVLFPAFSRTCEILASKPFSKPIALTGVPVGLTELLEDIDAAGRGIHAFFYDVLNNCLSHGISGVLADFPPTDGLRTVAEERAAGVRPYLVHYPAGSVLGWRMNGKALSNIRLLESAIIADGPFDEREVDQVRVLYAAQADETQGRWEIWRVDEKDPERKWIVYDSGVSSRSDIPFSFFYGNRIGFGTGISPLIDLAHMNVEHWQSACDQQTILHVARIPILFMKGFGAQEPLVIGAASAVKSSNIDAELKFVEHSGAAIGAGRTSLLDLEERMRAIGAELLVRKTNRMTATQVESEDTAGDCMLQAIVEMFELSIESCLKSMCDWMGLDGSEIEVEMYNEFSVSSLSDAKAQIVLLGREQGVISPQTVFETFRSAGMLDPELTWDEEKTRIAGQTVAPEAD